MKFALKFDIVEALRDNLHASLFRRGMRILDATLIASIDFPAKPKAAA